MTYTNPPAKLPIQDFFQWKRHPFADTDAHKKSFMPKKDQQQMETIHRLLNTGKSLALCGPSGSGKTTLAHALLNSLDKNSYRTIFIPYAGYPRNGLARIIAEALGVDIRARGLPMVARIQQHIEAMVTAARPLHPVIIMDDAQRMEMDSFWDLSAFLFQTSRQAAAASLILVGDENLAKRLELSSMLPIRSRLTGIMSMRPMDEIDTRHFIQKRLESAGAPPDLFGSEAMDLIAASTRGNRRAVMNMATMALEEAYIREEKTISAELFYGADWFNRSE
ncbi:ExeA family protein [Desulfobotulus mexicanus]|uniref:AAA family ATPase n=1 Tax=Desulfobotulus mexicanus TaxID=2586642 RepID=A0A5S5MEV7_9BACT|nr:AAA family ATPase [Desulfobotulus mexicanus]TYT74261.1 AAA family ATPase [Desulfobotulus mexicanus]